MYAATLSGKRLILLIYCGGTFLALFMTTTIMSMRHYVASDFHG